MQLSEDQFFFQLPTLTNNFVQSTLFQLCGSLKIPSINILFSNPIHYTDMIDDPGIDPLTISARWSVSGKTSLGRSHSLRKWLGTKRNGEDAKLMIGSAVSVQSSLGVPRQDRLLDLRSANLLVSNEQQKNWVCYLAGIASREADKSLQKKCEI